MSHQMLVEKMIQSLALDIEAVHDDSIIQLSSTSKRTPLKVKVKVRKKDKNDAYNGFISVPKSHPTGTTIHNIRLVDSDQTIMSFDMFMDTDNSSPIKKSRTRFFDLLRPGICLGKANDENECYQPNKSQDNNNINSKSDAVLKKHLALSKKDYLHSPTAISRHQHFLGKCKPGGCLDPPFNEDKYAYVPNQGKEIQFETSTLIRKNLNLGDEVRISKQDLIIEQILSKEKLPRPNSKTELKILKAQPGNNSILNLYQAASINTSLSLTYSNSIITYPPPLTTSEIRLNNEKNAQLRMSTVNRLKNSYNEFSQTYFIAPKDLTNKDYRSRPKDEKNSFKQSFCLKSEMDSNFQDFENKGQDIIRTIASTATKTDNYEEYTYTDIKTALATDNIIGIQKADDNSKTKDITPLHKSDSAKDSPLETTRRILTTLEMKHDKTTSKSGSITVKNSDSLFKPSVRSSLAETNLNLYKTLPQQLIQKENIIESNNLYMLPLSLNENTTIKDEIHSASIISKGNFENCYNPSEFERSKCLSEDKHLNEGNVSQICYIDSDDVNNIKSISNIGKDSEIGHVFEKTQVPIKANVKKESLIPYNSVTGSINITSPQTYINNVDNTGVKYAGESSTRFDLELPSKHEDQQQIEDVKYIDTHLIPNNKEIRTYDLNNTASEIDYVVTGVTEISQPVTYDQSNTTEDDILLNDAPKYADDLNLNENSNKDFTSKLTVKSSMSYDDEATKLENYAYRTSLSSGANEALTTNENTNLDNNKQKKNYQIEYKPKNPKSNSSQIVFEVKDNFEGLTRKSSVQTIEDVNSKCSSPIREDKCSSDTGNINFYKTATNENLKLAVESFSSEKDLPSSKAGIFKDDITQLADINENTVMQPSVLDSELDNPKDKIYNIDSTTKFKSNSQSNHMLRNTENQLENNFVKNDSNYSSLINQSPVGLLNGKLKPLEVAMTQESFNPDLETNTINISRTTEIDTKSYNEVFSKQTTNLIPHFNTNVNIDIVEPINTHEIWNKSNNEGNIDNIESIDKSLLRHDSKTRNQNTSNLAHIASNLSFRVTDNTTLSQGIPNRTVKYNLVSTEPKNISEPKTIKAQPLEKQHKTIPLKSPVLLDEQNIITDRLNNQKELHFGNSKVVRQSTMFDITTIPHPKQLKEDIANLKYHSVVYTPSENTLNKEIQAKKMTVDLAFHSYVNDKNEKTIKTFDSEKEPQRYSGDRVIRIKSDMNLSNNIMKIPIDTENSLYVKIKRTGETIQVNRDYFKDVEKLFHDREIDAKKTHTIKRSDVKMPDLHSFYETELMPLQNAIKDLKDEIDYLAGHTLILRSNLHTRQLRPLGLTKINKRCVCLKKQF